MLILAVAETVTIPSEPESVFGQIKNNQGFRRFLLRGLQKASLEVGWLSLALNLFKKVAVDRKIEMTVQD
ncbi:transposase [Paenibacillus cellulosilyticus]|uniref:transposase n=1 Tax=Paenibacillus cellulosilyticus TaxID=375489 RepID=UPI001580ECD2